MTDTVRHVTANLCKYGDPLTGEQDIDRMKLVLETLECTGGDVFSVQELHADTATNRRSVFVELATVLGFECQASDQYGATGPVIDPGRGVFGIGVMWRPDRIQPVPGSRRCFDRAPLAMGMAQVRLRIDDRVEISVASTHAPSRSPGAREDEAVYVGAEVYVASRHGIVGADWNNVFASRTPGGDYYDHDPYHDQPWHPSHIGKAIPNPATGTGIARREAMQAVEHAGLVDPAAFIDAPWYRTTGHWNSGKGNKKRIDKRIDGPMVTLSVAVATTSIQSFDDIPAHHASDHLPVILEVDVNTLANQQHEAAGAM